MGRLIECRDCGPAVSRSADACPSCGKRLRRRWYEVGPFTTGLVFILLALFVLGMCSSV
jgi:predicted amidophosphoribosyltransferase